MCGLAGSLTFLDDIRAELKKAGIQTAVAKYDTPTIFDWLLEAFSYQGVSDQVARNYMREHGNASWSEITASLKGSPPCPLLQSHWHFEGRRYDKNSFTCSPPERIGRCPLPRQRLRNGRLNQTAYSFYLFVRDIAGGDLVDWIDRRLDSASSDSGLPPSNSQGDPQERLLGPLRNIYGVSDKLLTMTLSGLLLAASEGRPRWFETGKAMIAVDTLVHNFLHRTGILDDCGVPHGYGVRCYGQGGCAEIIRAAASRIDTSIFNAQNPTTFPRFVQHAIWRFCAADEDLLTLGMKLPVGRIYARGKSFIPNIRRDLYDKIHVKVGKSHESEGGTAPPSADTSNATLACGLPQDWRSIAAGHLVLVQESLADGWWEALVLGRENDVLTLRFRDYPKVPTFELHVSNIAMINPGPV